MKVRRFFNFGVVLATSVASLPLCIAQQAIAAEVQTKQYDIPAQPLATALLEYSRQSDRRVQAPMEWLKGKDAPALRGMFTPDEALNRLLANTGIAAVVSEKGRITLRRTAQGEFDAGHGPAAIDSAEAEPEIVVTGSHIRGKIAAGAVPDVYDRQAIDQSGYATVHDFLQTIPQNFQGGGGTEDAFTGPLLTSNAFNGSSVNLRGLGADATLILINGRRLPSSGLGGDFTDISNIPQAAVERIEVLSDGASALYGSDAVGGVVNIILRKDFDGAETRARYGTVTKGNLDEYRAAQAFGTNWGTGNALLSYEFYKRDNLFNRHRSYAATADLRPFGGADRRISESNPGNILDPVTFQPAFAIPANQDGRNLTVADLIPGQVNLGNNIANGDILPKQKRHSMFATVEQNITNTLTAFVEFRYSERKNTNLLAAPGGLLFVPETNPFYVNPFGNGGVIVSYSLEEELGIRPVRGRVRTGSATAGARLMLGGGWRLETYAHYGQEKSRWIAPSPNFDALGQALADSNPTTAFNPFGDGKVNNPETIAKLWNEYTENPNSKVTSINSVVDGPVFSINGRQVSLALGGEYRNERFSAYTTLNGDRFRSSSLDRAVHAAFAELYVPLFAPDDNVTFLHALDLSVAGRYESYNEEGSTTNPKIGLRWQPIRHIALNATYGTSFRAPNLMERLTTRNSSRIARLRDPKSSSGRTATVVLFGNDPEMTHETAETWTAGLSLQPTVVKGLSGRVSYFNTKFKDRISSPDDFGTIFFSEEMYSDLITRSPSAELLTNLCSDPAFTSNRAECIPSIIGAVLDFRTQNIAKNTVRGLDFLINYNVNTSLGSTSLGLSGTYLIDHVLQATATSPKFDLVDRLGQPIDFRARGYLTHAWKSLTGTVTVNYTDSYRNDASELQSHIKSHTTVDVNLSFFLNDLLKIKKMPEMQLALSAINIFDRDPPFVDNPVGVGYDSSNAEPLGRFLSADLRIRW